MTSFKSCIYFNVSSMFTVVILISILQSALLWQEKMLLGSDESEYPNGHLKYMENIQRRHICSVNGHCHQTEKVSKHCWGYEKDCEKEHLFHYPTCDKPTDKAQTFWNQGGFGYVKKVLDSIKTFCEPIEGDIFASEFKCSHNWQHCSARNILMDLTDIQFATDTRNRYNGNFFAGNRLGGYCHLNKDLFGIPAYGRNDELTSWNAELSHYSVFEQNPFNNGGCDEIIEKPTFFMKLDSPFNMYHHFCDFFNLYVSQHIHGNFSTDVYIVNWDTSIDRYWDGLFGETWKVFSKYPIKKLRDFNGKKVCFKNAIFALLPRMVEGLYYSTSLVPGCRGGGLLKAFSEHVLHRLGIHQENNVNDTLRITMLKRNTQFRNILNEDELLAAIERLDGVTVNAVDYNHQSTSFLEQLRISHNSDMFIGIHGAGLTHIMFQPDWGVAFELYNTEDAACYRDLARLRGLVYLTWEDNKLLYPYNATSNGPKFTNYKFDVNEFIRLVTKAIKIVKMQKNSGV